MKATASDPQLPYVLPTADLVPEPGSVLLNNDLIVCALRRCCCAAVAFLELYFEGVDTACALNLVGDGHFPLRQAIGNRFLSIVHNNSPASPGATSIKNSCNPIQCYAGAVAAQLPSINFNAVD